MDYDICYHAFSLIITNKIYLNKCYKENRWVYVVDVRPDLSLKVCNNSNNNIMMLKINF